MDAILTRAQALRGSISVPPDKSILQRAILISGVADGITELESVSSSDDCRRVIDVVEGLGVTTRSASGTLQVRGLGRSGFQAPTDDLYCGESGTTLRLSAGLLSGQDFRSTLSAGTSLCRRPMRRIIDPLSQMGANVLGRPATTKEPGAARDVFPPLIITGCRPLRSITYRLPVASAQVKSAVLLAGLFADGATTVVEPMPTRDHTERLLRRFDAVVHQEGLRVTVEGGRSLRSPGRLSIPGDFSSAAILLVAAACVPGSALEIHEVGLNPTRTQLLAVLERMGAAIRVEVREQAWEPRGIVRIEARPLRGTTVEPHEVPGMIDELPGLMVAACAASGTTVLRGIGELRVKETDRISSMVEGLKRLGARVRQPEADVVEIEGGAMVGAAVEGRGDHRTAMALAVAGVLADGSTRIMGAECVQKSYREFFEMLRSLAGRGAVATTP